MKQAVKGAKGQVPSDNISLRKAGVGVGHRSNEKS
jgi:hypothetical protein